VSTPRAAVYDRFWRSRGGGERHAGMIAQVLREDGVEVELLGHEPVDLAEMAGYLGLDLSGCTYRQLPDLPELELAEATEGYDLVVNATYTSRLRPRSRRSAYLCFFPTPADHDLDPLRRAAVRLLGPALRGTVTTLGAGPGWYLPEGRWLGRSTWTSGDAELLLPPGPRRLGFSAGRPGNSEPTTLTFVADDGGVLAEVPVAERFAAHKVDLGTASRRGSVRLRSSTFLPAGGVDTRQLGVSIKSLRLVGRSSVRELAMTRLPYLTRDPRDLSWLEPYRTVMANSEYTRGWVQKLWRTDADVLYPPVQTAGLVPAATRDPVVLALGRFFTPGRGHAKRQLEMVQTFAALSRSGALPGWRMAVVGGCEGSQEPYLREVIAAGAGTPVEVIPNATRAEVERLLQTASVFWSATGWGEDGAKKPWTAEHFGMSTVEAMAGGCVPVVIDRAGQREIVRDGVEGFRFETLEQMGQRTVQLAGDDGLRARLSAAAVPRAHAYDEDAFRTRWRAIVAEHDLL